MFLTFLAFSTNLAKSIWTFEDLRAITVRNVSIVGKVLYFSKQLVIRLPQEVSKSKKETRDHAMFIDLLVSLP